MDFGLRRNNFFYKIIRIIGQVFFSFIYRLKVEGQERIPLKGPGIILPKHQFWTDIPLATLAAPKPLSFIAKQELFVNPVIRHFLTALGGVPVDRQKPLKSLDSFRYVEQLLKKGDFIVLFPEGTYYPHAIGGVKHRFIQHILRFEEKMGWNENHKIPFIPVGICYREKKFRTEVHVKIGQPIYSNGKMDGQEFTRRIINDIATLSGLLKTGVKESRIQA